MSDDGFWTGGPDEHRRAVEQRIAIVRKTLKNCILDDRERIARAIADAAKELQKTDDDQILW